MRPEKDNVVEADRPPSEKESHGSEHDEDLIYTDPIHFGLCGPTEDEKHTLRRVPDALPWGAYLVAIVELAERFSVRLPSAYSPEIVLITEGHRQFYGCNIVFTNFIQRPLPPGSLTGAGGLHGQAGALGLGQRASTGLTTFYQFWCYVTPLFGAYIADTYWGRYKTICFAVVVSFIGHVLLIIAALPHVIANGTALPVFVIALIVMGIGTGVLMANISPLIAEQYKKSKLFVVTTKKGERVIVDPALTVARIYMYFYLFINVGALVGKVSMTYAEKFVGFWLSFALPTVVYLLCPLVMYAGRNMYTRSPPTGSVLASALRLWRFAARGRWNLNPISTYKNLRVPGFWENAKPSRQPIGQRPVWMTFDDQWVDEVKRGVKACSVFAWYPIYWLTYNQLNNNLISQAAEMSTHGLPNDILSNMDPITIVILIPVFDMLLYPALRRMGIRFSALKKITAGFMMGAAGMVWAAVVQHYIYKTSPCGNLAAKCQPPNVSPLNVWIQVGAYILIAISEIFASITGLEYAFTKAPKNMRSLVMSLYLFMSAISSAIGEAFVYPLLVWNYGVMGILAFVVGWIFWWSTKDLDAQEDELNNLVEGHVQIIAPNEKA
ncbi:hypothetical protein D9619_010186 [Psilocybe cf. subviscida]|uniref:Major facilitator superfamily (MFS) profile domain-containing protein n=1 Tax=Psilocybe cf. subviscida TaxID=2480587 RepID=A0A8H5ASI0_9AGAR|nr:hypothetical protein D9619_010186 [Psilocybe cf. subviscida]